MADNQQKLSFASDVVLQVIDGEALILKLQSEMAFSLNATGTRIAQLIAEGRGMDTLVDVLSSEYGRSRDDVEREVNGLVQQLRSKGLVIGGRAREGE